MLPELELLKLHNRKKDEKYNKYEKEIRLKKCQYFHHIRLDFMLFIDRPPVHLVSVTDRIFCAIFVGKNWHRHPSSVILTTLRLQALGSALLQGIQAKILYVYIW